MTEKTDPIDAEILKLVKHVVKKGVHDDTPFPESVDALKAVNTYYALRLKHKVEGEEDDGTSFDSFTAQLQEQTHGGTPVRSRSRRPS